MTENVIREQIDPNSAFHTAPVIDRPAPKRKIETNPYKNEKRVWIVLERSDRIPPTGQYFGYTAEVEQLYGTKHRTPREYILRSGEKAWVPEGLVNVLNDAVESVPVKDAEERVVGYEDRLRFSYRIVKDPPPEGWVQPDEQPLQEAA